MHSTYKVAEFSLHLFYHVDNLCRLFSFIERRKCDNESTLGTNNVLTHYLGSAKETCSNFQIIDNPMKGIIFTKVSHQTHEYTMVRLHAIRKIYNMIPYSQHSPF